MAQQTECASGSICDPNIPTDPIKVVTNQPKPMNSKRKTDSSTVFKNHENFIEWNLNYTLPKGMGTGIDFSKPKK